MHTCEFCDSTTELPYQCNYCGAWYCPDHRLPEGHECDGVEVLSGSQGWFREKNSDNIVSSEEEFEAPQPIEPEYSVGTTPPADYESAPEVTLKSEASGGERSERSIVTKIILKILGR